MKTNFCYKNNSLLTKFNYKTASKKLIDKGLVARTKDKNGCLFNTATTPKFAEYFKLKGDLRSLIKQDIAKLLKNSTTIN